ncbi:MAG: DUF11 domain-containing protein, partial [Solirubrobacteraceae bacterium]|nr:DUF11 domain-containing protein [Solirubrobacteraceae bacterium]
TDRLPAGAQLRLATSSTGSCSESGGIVTCSLGTLTTGTSTVLTITVDLPASLADATISNVASVSSSVVDPTPLNATSSLARRLPPTPPTPVPTAAPSPSPTPAAIPEPPIVPGKANLALTKRAEGVARAGRELSYSITLFNRGPAKATETVVTDALVGGVEFKNARSANGGSCGFEAGTVRCKLGSVEPGESVNMRVIVVPSKTGMLVNDAVATSGTDDPDLADNRAVAQNTVSPRPPTKLTIKTTASSAKLRGGQRVTYTLKIKNAGPNEAVNVEACDRLPAGMSFTSTKGGVLKGSKLCLTQALLPPGKTATFKVKVRLSARARKGTVVSRLSADAENAALQNATATAKVITDGKVSAEVVRGFTG